MRTSLNRLKAIDDHIHHRLSPEDAILFEARLLVDPSLRDDTRLQISAYRIILLFGRRTLRRELRKIHHELFDPGENPAFRKSISNIFKQ